MEGYKQRPLESEIEGYKQRLLESEIEGYKQRLLESDIEGYKKRLLESEIEGYRQRQMKIDICKVQSYILLWHNYDIEIEDSKENNDRPTNRSILLTKLTNLFSGWKLW